MAGWLDWLGEFLYGTLSIQTLEAFLELNCPPYPKGLWSSLMVIFFFVPIYVNVLLLAASFYYQDIYMVIVSIGTTLCWLISMGITDEVPQDPAYPHCGNDFPSSNAQQLFFLFAVLLVYGLVYDIRFGRQTMGVIAIIPVITSYSMYYFQFNTFKQIFVGAIVGIGFGAVFQLIVYFLVAPYFEKIRKFYIISYFQYSNTIGKFLEDSQ